MKRNFKTSVFAFLFISLLTWAVQADTDIIALWGYNKNIRLCESANELFQAYLDINKIPELKKAIDAKLDKSFLFTVTFPKEVKYLSAVNNEEIWLFPKWSCKNPAVKYEELDGGHIISHRFSSKGIKTVGGRYGFGFVVNTLKQASSAKVSVSLSSGDTVLTTHDYDLEFLPPINGRRPKRMLVQLAYYPEFSLDILKQTFAENTIKSGFNDLMIMHNGSPWQDMEDVAMMRESAMRIIANFFTSGIFKKFPFDKHLEWNETDKNGKIKMRHRDLDMQRIIDKEPVIIKYLEDYFANLKKVYKIDGVQMDEERSPLGGFTELGINAFRKWAAIAPEVKLDVNSIKSDYMEKWIAFRGKPQSNK